MLTTFYRKFATISAITTVLLAGCAAAPNTGGHSMAEAMRPQASSTPDVAAVDANAGKYVMRREPNENLYYGNQ